MMKDDSEIIMELLDLSQQLIEQYEKYGLGAPREIVERLLEITREYTKVKDKEVKENEQTITKGTNQS
jgi:hypothetical protein